MTGSQMEQLLFSSTLLDIQYTQQQEHTHTHTHTHIYTHSTADERKGLFLDPCIVSEIAKEPSEQSHFRFAVKERVWGSSGEWDPALIGLILQVSQPLCSQARVLT